MLSDRLRDLANAASTRKVASEKRVNYTTKPKSDSGDPPNLSPPSEFAFTEGIQVQIEQGMSHPPKVKRIRGIDPSDVVTHETSHTIGDVVATAKATDESAIKAALSQRYDQLNALWKAAEDQLRQFNVPTEVRLSYDNGYDDLRQTPWDRCIAWAWCKGAWRLCYGLNDDYEHPHEFIPMVDASLDVRQECVKHFADLKKKVIEKAAETISALDDSIAKLALALK